jgi:hypothetical protein
MRNLFLGCGAVIRIGGGSMLSRSRLDSSPSVRVLFILCAAYAVWPSNAAAQRYLPFPHELLEPILNPTNGHYYEIVHGRWDSPLIPSNPSFSLALSHAESKSHLGIRGHLVTITSQSEQDFLLNAFGNPRLGEWLWIGASDAQVEGEWRWVSGPETGELFWLGNVDGTALGFESWGFNREPLPHDEPNNYNHTQPLLGEDFGAMRLFGPEDPFSQYYSTVWNDVADPSSFPVSRPVGFIVEYSPIPEPAGVVMAVASLFAATLVCCRERPSAG